MWPSGLRSLLALCLLFAQVVYGTESNLNHSNYFGSKNEHHDSSILISSHFSEVTIENVALKSAGFIIGYQHEFSKNFSIHSQLMLSLQSEGSNAMTGLGIYGIYNLFRDTNKKSTAILLDDKKLASISHSYGSHLELGFGAQQYYFNGQNAVYSVSGPSAHLNYRFNVFDLNFFAGMQGTMIKYNNQSLILNTLLFGMALPL